MRQWRILIYMIYEMSVTSVYEVLMIVDDGRSTAALQEQTGTGCN